MLVAEGLAIVGNPATITYSDGSKLVIPANSLVIVVDLSKSEGPLMTGGDKEKGIPKSKTGEILASIKEFNRGVELAKGLFLSLFVYTKDDTPVSSSVKVTSK
jgi:hypothetical protein